MRLFRAWKTKLGVQAPAGKRPKQIVHALALHADIRRQDVVTHLQRRRNHLSSRNSHPSWCESGRVREVCKCVHVVANLKAPLMQHGRQCAAKLSHIHNHLPAAHTTTRRCEIPRVQRPEQSTLVAAGLEPMRRMLEGNGAAGCGASFSAS